MGTNITLSNNLLSLDVSIISDQPEQLPASHPGRVPSEMVLRGQEMQRNAFDGLHAIHPLARLHTPQTSDSTVPV